MKTELYEVAVPSERQELLKSLRGLTLIKLVRYSWWPGSQSAERCSVELQDVFSLTAGPVLLYFNSGLVIGATSDPSKSSVIIWVEKNENREVPEYQVDKDEEYFAIDANDQTYSNKFWNQVLEQKIRHTVIIKREPRNAKYLDLPNEVGIQLTMENGISFMLSHGLHNNSDDFSVITNSQIDQRILPQLKGLI